MLIEFHFTFSVSYKILTNYVYYYCILIIIVQAVRTSFYLRARFTSFYTLSGRTGSALAWRSEGRTFAYQSGHQVL